MASLLLRLTVEGRGTPGEVTAISLLLRSLSPDGTYFVGLQEAVMKIMMQQNQFGTGNFYICFLTDHFPDESSARKYTIINSIFN
jgi:hypothetical protein